MRKISFQRPTLNCEQFQRPTLNLNSEQLPGSRGREEKPAFFSEYVLGQKLGSGTTAVVKRARRVADGLEVAVKCSNSDDEEVRSFVLEEYKLMCELQHDFIVGVYALHTAGSHLWVVMDWCDRGDLASYVERNGPLDEAAMRIYFHQILQAVDYLHKKRIVHRDLKPDNLLLTGGLLPDGTVIGTPETLKISDFNSATRVGDGPGANGMLSFRGTRLYSAPELMLGLVWNERVDIWACGLCLHYAVTAELPFDCTEVSSKKLLQEGVLPMVNWEVFSHDLKHMLEQCLCVEMRDRPPAMELLTHDFFKEAEEHAIVRTVTTLDGSMDNFPHVAINATRKEDPLRELQSSKYERFLRDHTESTKEDLAALDAEQPTITQLKRNFFHTWSPDSV